MAWFPDLSPCSYFGAEFADCLVAIAWLEQGRPFPTGPVDPEVYAGLLKLLRDPWQPGLQMGFHHCDADPELDEVFRIEDRPKARRRFWPTVLAFAVPAAIAGVIIVLLVLNRPPAAKPRPAEDPADKLAQVREAFAGPPAANDDPEIPRIQVLFERLGQAFRESDAAAIERQVDFDRLAEEVWRAGLQSLIAEHRAARPDDVRLHFWDAQLEYLKGDFAAAVALLEEHERELGASHSRWEYEERLVYALARSRHWDRALALARRQDVRDGGNPRMLAVVHASRGDVAETGQQLARMIEDGWTAANFYEDDVLGPALRSEAFASLRGKYPEPEPVAAPPGTSPEPVTTPQPEP